MKKRSTKTVTVKVHTGNTTALKEAHLYVFNKEGQLIETVALKNGGAELKTKAEDVEGNTQMIIGPGLPREFKGRNLNPIIIKKMGGFQPSIHLNASNEIHIFGVPKFPFCDWCLITGSLSKTFNIDGQNTVLPVCDARVHICEVDRIWWWWWRIPHYIVDALGSKLKEAVLNPNIVIPPHGPGPDPGPMMSMSEVRMGSEMKMSQADSKSFSAPSALPLHVQSGLLSSSAAVVRDTIYNNFHLLHPYLCLWPWFWPYFYFCDEIATVYTDCNGRFNYEYLNCANDRDIYVWVEACINGQWLTVYRPPVPCNTKWNYTCGSDITISITDPRVMPCNCGQHLQGELVWFRSIGEYATALHIEQGNSHTVNVQGVSLPNVGCTDITDSNRISPFGSTLYFKLLFGDGLAQNGHYSLPLEEN
jgi:hypothetical protein